jgi:glycolate oxidase
VNNKNIINRLQDIVGNESVLTSQEDLLGYSYDGTPLHSEMPVAAVIPESTEQISRIIKLANEESFSVVPRGSGTGLSGGSVPVENSIVLLMNHWSKILEIDQENFTALVEPGVITADLHREVEQIGLFYPPDPASMSICTIGGNVAENSGGLRGLKYGVVATYNLKDLMVGSEGTLGIFTKILLKLIPLPQTSKTMLAYFASIREAAETVSDIIAARIIPVTLEFLDNTAITCVENYAHMGLDISAGALLLIEVDGHPAQVDEEAEKIVAICTRKHAMQIQIARDDDEALKLKTARRAAFPALACLKPTTILEDATVPRSQLGRMVEKVQQIAQKHDILIGNFGHAGDGNLHPTALTDERDKDELHRVEKAYDEIFQAAVELGGTITGEHGVGLAKKRFLADSIDQASFELMRKLKEFLDPNGVLNPGKIFDLRPKCEGPLPNSRQEIKRFDEIPP